MRDKATTVEEFVDRLRCWVTEVEWVALTEMARDGKMGFGPDPNDFGTEDGKG